MTLYLLKLHLETFLSIPIAQKCQILSCDTRDHWGDPEIDGRIILRRIFRKWEGAVGTGWSRLRIGTVGGHL
jgi:hypothetical protein